MKKYFIYSLYIFISCFFIKPVFALNINTPVIEGVSYVNESTVKINYNSSNSDSSYKVQIYNMTLGKFESDSITSTSHEITGLTVGKTYNFIMRAYCGTTVSDWSNIVSATPKMGVPVINSITAGDKSLTLNYATNGSPKEVEIYNSNTGTSISSSNLSKYTVSNLTNGTTYKFVIRNCYGNGECGNWSNTMSGTPKYVAPTPAPAPASASYVSSKGKIGQAASGESGCKRKCKAGDQKSGKEVSIFNFSYSSKSGKYNNWKYVARFKDPAKANKAASSMEAACKNNNIGYDQAPSGGRTELYKAAKSVNYDFSKIKKKVEVSCSPLVMTCVASTGISVPDKVFKSDTRDSNMRTYFKNHSKDFTILTDKKYLTSYKNLKRGDILVSPSHHTAMAL